jgi:hypothetical protein
VQTTQVVPLHSGVVPLQATLQPPQWFASFATHFPSQQNSPLPQLV